MHEVREKIFRVIQPAAKDNFALASWIFDVAITTLVLLSVICVFAITFDLPPSWVKAIQWIEASISVIFTIEYILRLFTADFLDQNKGEKSMWRAMLQYMRSGMALVDLVAILPFYLPMVFPCNLLAVRIFRLLRLLRIFKLNRYFASLAAIGQVIKSKSRELLGSLFFVALMLVVSSLVIYAVEHDAQPDVFKNAFSGLWWAIATLTTVGYGDIYPVTTVGRMVGAVIALLGIGMVAIPTGIISSGLIEQMKKGHSQDVENEKSSDCVFCPHCGKRLHD
jgi:voltage-gated potassium channel